MSVPNPLFFLFLIFCPVSLLSLVDKVVQTAVFQKTFEQKTSWKQDLYDRCIDYTDCITDVLSGNNTDSVTKNAARRELEQWKPRCVKLEFMTGKFSQCYDSMVFSKSNPIRPFFKNKTIFSCEFTKQELGDVKAVIFKSCGLAAVRDMKMNEEIAKKMLCGYSVSKVMFEESSKITSPAARTFTTKPIKRSFVNFVRASSTMRV